MGSGYFGSEAQIRFQEKSDRLTGWAMATPGACVTGRVMASDDPDRLGWDVIRQHLEEDGAFGFRWMSPEQSERIARELAHPGVTFHSWNGFHGTADAIRRVGATVPGLPEGLALAPVTGPALARLQGYLADHGIAPLSTAALGGSLFPAAALALTTPGGDIAAAGWVAMAQNRYSALARTAWAGLIAVDPAWRGKGLGRRINTEVLNWAVDNLGAEAAIEFAAADNMASIAMIRGSGLSLHANVSLVASLGQEKLTR